MRSIVCHLLEGNPNLALELKQWIEQDPEIELTKISHTPKEAIKAIRLQRPDLLIVDFSLSDFGDPELTEEIDAYDIPAVIVTAELTQIEQDSPGILTTDFILKPFEKKRVLFSLNRAKTAIKLKKPDNLIHRVNDLIQQLNEKNKQFLKRISVKKGDKIFFIETDEIDYIETAGNYLKIHYNGKSQMIRETLTNMISQLDPEQFFRIHRTTVVQLKKVQEFQSHYHGDYIVLLKNGAKLSMSRNFKDILAKAW
jgi:two-component system LytT family response regulator